MLENVRKRMGREEGFTLIELLVVMLILGILAAIAIPSFLNQRSKAQDSDAKANARTAQTAMETCATENDGSYTPCDEDALVVIEPTLGDAVTGGLTAVPAAGGDGYVVTSPSDSGDDFTITRSAPGNITYSANW